MQITRDNLKPFQLRAAGEIAQMLATYPLAPYIPQFDPDTGKPNPFLCRLKAITGSGKTPILALSANTLGDAIILWTTNRGAVISQTASNLSEGGSYAALLPTDAQIRELNSLSTSDWNDIVGAKQGLTILLGTVALFNQDPSSEVLNVHKDRGGTTYWEMLAGRGTEARHRPLYIVYDEAHGGTKAQFSRLKELDPRAFILASASTLPQELADLLPGRDSEKKSASLERQTVKVPTREVVETGLLKTRLYLVDCNTTRSDAVKEANDKWLTISQKIQKEAKGEWPVMCCIVNSTLAGLELWEILTQELKVDPTRVAVHLASVDKHLAEVNPNAPWGQLIDTHKAKKTPEKLRSEGYTHLIWNLSLREGWDEPWAYVAYLDGKGKSTTDISQKIGRFLRQPNAAPFADGDLNSAYFYFNIPDEEFAALVRATQSELEDEGYEVIMLSGNNSRLSASRESPVKSLVQIAKVSESFGDDPSKLDNILLDNIPLFADEELKAPGRVTTRVLDLRRNSEDGSLQKEERRDDNAEIRVWNYLVDRLSAMDSRVAQKNGTCFTPFVKDEKPMKQKMQFGSGAMTKINAIIPKIQQQLNAEFRLEYEPDQVYQVRPFNLVSPDIKSEDDVKRERYRVRTFKNALHSEYNGMNPFEVKIAEALDTLNLDWCRNPSKTGYGIPIPEIGQGTTNFYPDFLLWTKKCLWAIDPKGPQLLNDAIRTKLLGVSDVEGLPLKIRVAFAVEEEWVLGANERPVKQSKDGCTLIWKENGIIRAKQFKLPSKLVNDLK